MDIGSIFVGLALATAAAAYIGMPILAKGGVAVSKEDRRLSELQAQRDRILTRLQELDMDYAMGKILEADYQAERAASMQHGAQVLKTIDDLVGSAALPQKPVPADDEIEAAVTRIRAGSQPAAAAAAYCPSCGKPVQPGDGFCTHCGTSLEVGG